MEQHTFPTVHVQVPFATRTVLQVQGQGAGTAAGIAALAACNNSLLLELTEGEKVWGE